MKVVLDASAAYIALSGSNADAALRDADALLAPDVLVPELLSARWKMSRAGYAVPTLDLIRLFMEHVRLVGSLDYATEAYRLAELTDYPVYDCLYAAVAARADATLLTADARFVAKIPTIRTLVVSTSRP